MSGVSCVTERVAKSEDSCDAEVLPAVHWFEDKPSNSANLHCVSIASDGSDAVGSRELLQMWANRLSVHIEVNVLDDCPAMSLELTTMRAACRAALT